MTNVVLNDLVNTLQCTSDILMSSLSRLLSRWSGSLACLTLIY